MDFATRRDGSAGYLTNLAARLFTRALERRLEDGRSGPMPVFFALIDGGALPQKALAQLAAVEQPTMANTLARMQRDGFVASAPDPADRRSTLIRLTPLGMARARAALKVAKEVNDLGIETLAPGEREAFLDMLGRIVARLEADAV